MQHMHSGGHVLHSVHTLWPSRYGCTTWSYPPHGQHRIAIHQLELTLASYLIHAIRRHSKAS